MSGYYMKEVIRPRRKVSRWLVGAAGTADYAVFKDRTAAARALADLQKGKARFCSTCGHWLIYSGGQEEHGCP